MSNNTKHTEQSMQHALRWFISSPKWRLENLYVFAWESDLLFLTPAGYWYEIEIKISRADFFNDANKMVGIKKKSEVLTDPGRKAPNHFYYAVPEGLITVDEVPDYAGLIEVSHTWKIVKKAPRLRGKIELNQSRLAEKFYHNWMNERGNHLRTRRELENTKRRYADVDALIEEKQHRAIENERYWAVSTFKIMCRHFDHVNIRCVKEGGESSRCGWCDEIKKFERLIYREHE